MGEVIVEQAQGDGGAEESRGPGQIRRRGFVKGAVGVAGFAATAAVLAACAENEVLPPDGSGAEPHTPTGAAGIPPSGPQINWDMATSWPESLVTLYGAAQFFADKVSELTGGAFKITPKPAGEPIGALEVLPAVRDLEVDMGHSAAYYHVDLSPVQQFGTTVPFGLTQRQQNAWLYQAGGLKMLNDFYANEHGIITFPAGNTGCQMGGWFTKEVETVADLAGLRMRIPGIAGQVLENLGGIQVALGAGEIHEAIHRGEIDSAEFVGPTDDLILGLDEFDGQLYYYHPGWWEPGTTLEVQIPLERWHELPPHYQSVVEIAAMAANIHTVAHYDYRNQTDLKHIQQFAIVREFSPELMRAFKAETENVLNGLALEDPQFREIFEPWRSFRDSISEWHGLAERSFLSQQSTIWI
ncbi:MAG: hypothetical protein OXH78_04775 [Acidimicrobiaceae bacterium]|nr:hypothetical protein [Acidimicrobiaceae bacterium]